MNGNQERPRKVQKYPEIWTDYRHEPYLIYPGESYEFYSPMWEQWVPFTPCLKRGQRQAYGEIFICELKPAPKTSDTKEEV